MCPHHISKQTPLLKSASKNIMNFSALNNIDKFCSILKSKDPDMIKALGNFLNKVL